jgi:hypothetical protein
MDISNIQPPPPRLYMDMLGHIPDISLTYWFFFKSFQLDHANLGILGAILGILGIIFMPKCTCRVFKDKMHNMFSLCFCVFGNAPVIGHVKVDTSVKYIPVIKNSHFYCSFGTSLASTRILVCKSYKKSLF